MSAAQRKGCHDGLEQDVRPKGVGRHRQGEAWQGCWILVRVMRMLMFRESLVLSFRDQAGGGR